MSCKKEIIRLDARLVDVVPEAAFLGELGNGHQVVAYARGQDKSKMAELRTGDTVTVEMSPFDMSAGRIVDFGPRVSRDESQDIS